MNRKDIAYSLNVFVNLIIIAKQETYCTLVNLKKQAAYFTVIK